MSFKPSRQTPVVVQPPALRIACKACNELTKAQRGGVHVRQTIVIYVTSDKMIGFASYGVNEFESEQAHQLANEIRDDFVTKGKAKPPT